MDKREEEPLKDPSCQQIGAPAPKLPCDRAAQDVGQTLHLVDKYSPDPLLQDLLPA